MTEQQQRNIIIGVSVVALVLLALMITAAVFLVNNPSTAATVRDVFIIFMALEAMVIGVALVILIVQVAALTNLLKNEIKPILLATQETVNTVRGTAIFVSENLTEPVMKLNSYVAGLSKIVEAISSITSIFRRL
jgi:predicted tellurium resistance membrane protein TerC